MSRVSGALERELDTNLKRAKNKCKEHWKSHCQGCSNQRNEIQVVSISTTYLITPFQTVSLATLQLMKLVDELFDAMFPHVVSMLFGLGPGERCALWQKPHSVFQTSLLRRPTKTRVASHWLGWWARVVCTTSDSAPMPTRHYIVLFFYFIYLSFWIISFLPWDQVYFIYVNMLYNCIKILQLVRIFKRLKHRRWATCNCRVRSYH